MKDVKEFAVYVGIDLEDYEIKPTGEYCDLICVRCDLYEECYCKHKILNCPLPKNAKNLCFKKKEDVKSQNAIIEGKETKFHSAPLVSIQFPKTKSTPEEVIKEQIDHPDHYNQYEVEVIEMMQRIWGKEAVKQFCILNAFKYRLRAGNKNDTSEDLQKEKWYLQKAKNL